MTDDADGAGNVAVLGTELTMTGSTLWATSSYPLYICTSFGNSASLLQSLHLIGRDCALPPPHLS
ncbi:hypothetical protein DPMN_122545 [Dreissena polymorpha]|uniref:Uncharacterized protein n=1 Tax=Dreissena polymorpha TaxID=45954 RepID=A0A9D4GSS2_DREPO|nr:hypothetical protein DPMN_122545 [Dreissena polymorpha]